MSRLLWAAAAAAADDDDDRLQWINPPHGVIVSFTVEKYILDCHDYIQHATNKISIPFFTIFLFAKCKLLRREREKKK